MNCGRLKPILLFLVLTMLSTGIHAQLAGPKAEDPFLWLENATDSKAMDWVKAHDSATMKVFGADPNFLTFNSEILPILNSSDRIPKGNYEGGYVYDFWQDDIHVKGILRRATLQEYCKKDPAWETVLDIDRLSADEGKDYVYQSTSDLYPDKTRGMIALSLGGGDAVIQREFDYVTKTFVKDGFFLPEAKSEVYWYDMNTLLVATDFGPGSMTSSGYPRIAKMWKRGTPLAQATTIIEGAMSDVGASAYVSFRPEGNRFFCYIATDFWNSTTWLVDTGGSRIELPFPQDSELHLFKNRLLALLNSPWMGIPDGSLVAVKIADLQIPDIRSRISVVYQPDEKSTVNEVSMLKDYVVVTILDNVRGKALYYTLDESAGADKWLRGEMNLPDMGDVSVTSADSYSNVLLLNYQDFLTPPKQYYFSDPTSAPQEVKAQAPKFDAGNLKVEQFFATSTDGTSIPYFMVSGKDIILDGSNPTLLYGYGGFRDKETPFYSGYIGKAWTSRGGIFVLANIRGGAEFGPRWHKAGLLENRQKVFDDFTAVAEDLISRKVTSPEHLGIMGGSNGGLLVGVAFTQRPELFKAVVCQVPLLDMFRYTKIGAGASWIAEYGDPEKPEQWAFIGKYSPYQNLKSGVKYPEVLFETSTTDDRVHPAHARKMTALMEQMGYKVFYYEETTGGHSASANNAQKAHRIALEYAYLWKMLK
jgi:prolyl oligopeptidase